MTVETKEKLVKEVMVPLDLVHECINYVLTDFTNQELGNKISTYSIQGLANTLLKEVKNPSPELIKILHSKKLIKKTD